MNPLKDRLQPLMAQLADELSSGRPARLITLLCSSTRWRQYSAVNRILIAAQAPHASWVLPRKKWAELGRTLNATAAAISIYAPRLTGQPRDPDAPEPDSARRVAFICVPVYDVADTQGDALPEHSFPQGGDHQTLLGVLQHCPLQVQWRHDVQAATLLGPQLFLPSSENTEGGDIYAVLHGWAQHDLEAQHPNALTLPQTRQCEAALSAMMVSHGLGVDAVALSAEQLSLHWGGKPKKLHGAVKRAVACAERLLSVLNPLSAPQINPALLTPATLNPGLSAP